MEEYHLLLQHLEGLEEYHLLPLRLEESHLHHHLEGLEESHLLLHPFEFFEELLLRQLLVVLGGLHLHHLSLEVILHLHQIPLVLRHLLQGHNLHERLHLKSLGRRKGTSYSSTSLWSELQKDADAQSAALLTLMYPNLKCSSAAVPRSSGSKSEKNKASAKSDKVHMVIHVFAKVYLMDNFLMAFHVHNLDKLKDIMKKILSLGNTLNQGTATGCAVGFRLDSLLKLTDTRATNIRITFMHYLWKVLAEKSTRLMDFHEDLIPLKSVAKEQQQILKGLEMELIASKHDGPVSETFCKGKNTDSLALYFGEDPMSCPFEQVVSTLLNFVRLFRRAHEMDCKQAELEKKKAPKEAEEKSKERCIYMILASKQSENLAQQMPRRLQTGLRLSYTNIMYTVFSSPFLREAVFWQYFGIQRGVIQTTLWFSLLRNFTRTV
ncbi:hypothetical protein ZIOFF_036239 [Zingiber officinale]|uniref:FH2 domain-containing protein n=1 Tax=Zingiber officinale TaxID=94328 RepID=A0A8J5GDV9_ZINOF|nr:hypothetical protein ZIOFF_036239 [Zingiber officinale]